MVKDYNFNFRLGSRSALLLFLNEKFNLIYKKKDIVVQGSNLGLTLNKLRFSLLTRKIFNVPEDKMSIIINLLLLLT